MVNYRVGYLVEDGGNVLAVFLDSAGECNPGNLLSYALLGEHSEAAVDYVRAQPLADERQYQELHAYLGRRYGDSTGEPLRLVVDQAGVPRR
jgi:hypothetical protein